MVTYHEDESNKLLADLKSAQEEAFVHQTADEVGIPYRDLTGESINTDALRLIPMKTACGADSIPELEKMLDMSALSDDEKSALNEKMLASGEMAAFALVGKKLDVAVKSPIKETTANELSRLGQMGMETNVFMVSSRSLRKVWTRYGDLSKSEASHGGLLDISDENLQQIVNEVHGNGDVQKKLTDIIASRDLHEVSRLLETIFGSAIALGSSDVHFEPEEKFARLRFREDGVLQEIIQLDSALYQKLLNRLKFISGMKLTITETAQDGRFTIFYKAQEMEVRVAVAPGAYNESVVMRILNPDGLAIDFGKLGIEPRILAILEREIAKPNGMILTTGPTGSGKTTTLYSFLKKVYTPEKKIITIEDPIEYHLPGITQEQINHKEGFDFLAGLRAALRQDPEIIMVGEIRDKETATIAVNASLTGHMVFSTLHTNNAAGTIPRLLDLGIQPGILSNALTVSIAQRLIRRLCPDCKKQVALSPDKEELLRAVIKNAERIGKDFAVYKISSTMEFSCYESVGCNKCNQTGFRGRVGLYEVILMDDIMAEMTIKQPSPTERDIKKAAEHQKIFTLIEDGVIKILSGLTSFDEVQSVVDLSEDVGGGEAREGADTPSVRGGDMRSMTGGVSSEQQNTTHPLTPSSRGGTEHSAGLGETSGEEIILLVDYLRLLQDHQQKNPSVGIADKIARAKDMIISILENTPNIESLFSNINPAVAVRDQIESLRQELSDLEQDQMKNPDVGVADQIGKIRNTIQSMRTEVLV